MQSVEPSKLFLLASNPTAENMARYLLEEVCPGLLTPCGVEAVRIDLWESEETCAIVTIGSGVDASQFVATDESLTHSIG